jgi:hypothetical protein
MAVMVARPQYNSAHKQRRTRAIAALIPGSPCPRCSAPMYATPRAAVEAGLPPIYGTLHLDHIQPVMLGGANGPVQLCHARCNLVAGGRLGAYVTNRRRSQAARQQRYNRW